MKKIPMLALLLAALSIACAPGFSEKGIERTIEKAGPFDVSVSIDDDNNVRVTLNEITGDLSGYSTAEEKYFYFVGVCVGAVGALASKGGDELGNLEIRASDETLVLSLDFCSYLAQASLDNTETDLGTVLMEVLRLQSDITSHIEDTGPFKVLVTFHPGVSGYDVLVRFKRASKTDRTWNTLTKEGRFGYFMGACTGAVGGAALNTSLSFSDLLVDYEGGRWSVPVEHCTDLVLASYLGTMTNDELGEALLNKLTKVR